MEPDIASMRGSQVNFAKAKEMSSPKDNVYSS
jgi:hypothetical protein